MTRQPAIVDLGNGKYQFIFNQEEIQRPDSDDPEETIFVYEYVEVPSPHPDDIIRALIHRVYSIDDEIALINNYNSGEQAAIDEYEAYQQYREEVKALVSEILV